MSLFSDISEALQKGRVKTIEDLVRKALESGITATEILEQGLLEGMNIIGVKFKNDEIYLPEVVIAARAMAAGAEILRPKLVGEGAKAKGRACIGTVKGDKHDIGKNLVKMMMEGKGLEVIDLGTGVTAEQFVNTAEDRGCQVIACSALLTTTVGEMRRVVEVAREAGIRDRVMIMVGGAPVTQGFCDSIGADCYRPDAASAAEAAFEYCEKYNFLKQK